MKLIKKVFRYLLFSFIILVLFSPLWVSKIPMKYLSFLVGKTSVADKYICKYSVQVSSDSMSPIISQGSSVELNRCFTKEDLSEEIIVLFGKDSEYRLGIIRHILPLDPVIYKVSNEIPNERLQDIVFEEIIAIGEDVDTNKSIYKPPEDLNSLVLDPNEYLSDLYLGKIPRGYGIEMAEVEKTNIFSRDNDKFCLVVVPKKELAFVDTETIELETGKIVNSSENIVFNVRSEPNINCEDFGDSQGMLNLDKGNYRYRFLLNHQVLADVLFSVE